MKAVLISIRKKYNDKIIEGIKLWEGRKKIPKELKETANIGKLIKPIIFYVYEPYAGGGCGKVRYKFMSYNAYNFKPQYTTEYEWSKIANVLCVANKWAKEYYNGDDGYLIRIENPEVFDNPKNLSEFRILCKHYACCLDDCKYLTGLKSYEYDERDCAYDGFIPLTRPPQSWFYVEV